MMGERGARFRRRRGARLAAWDPPLSSYYPFLVITNIAYYPTLSIFLGVVMASSRLSVSLHPERAALLRSFAAAQGVSVSRVLDELLASIEPSLTRTLALFQAASSAPESVRRQLADSVASVERSLLAADSLSSAQIDAITTIFNGSAIDPSNPRIVTRGSHDTGTNENNGLRNASNYRSYRKSRVKNV